MAPEDISVGQRLRVIAKTPSVSYDAPPEYGYRKLQIDDIITVAGLVPTASGMTVRYNIPSGTCKIFLAHLAPVDMTPDFDRFIALLSSLDVT